MRDSHTGFYAAGLLGRFLPAGFLRQQFRSADHLVSTPLEVAPQVPFDPKGFSAAWYRPAVFFRDQLRGMPAEIPVAVLAVPGFAFPVVFHSQPVLLHPLLHRQTCLADVHMPAVPSRFLGDVVVPELDHIHMPDGLAAADREALAAEVFAELAECPLDNSLVLRNFERVIQAAGFVILGHPTAEDPHQVWSLGCTGPLQPRIQLGAGLDGFLFNPDVGLVGKSSGYVPIFKFEYAEPDGMGLRRLLS